MRLAITLALMPQPPMGSQARDPLGAPALAHGLLDCFAGGVGLVIGSVDMRSVFSLALMPQPPMGSQARDPLGAPALAHVS
ncbi:hypothetical protein, partial [Yersinia massiliensis]|uniref:hypothetical protein n=1 Tax=Yersinia massiliensis TaxID=419257 RepID=UPI0025AADB2E